MLALIKKTSAVSNRFIIWFSTGKQISPESLTKIIMYYNNKTKLKCSTVCHEISKSKHKRLTEWTKCATHSFCFVFSEITYTLTLDADLQSSRVTSRGMFVENNERLLKDVEQVPSTSLCKDYKVYVQVVDCGYITLHFPPRIGVNYFEKDPLICSYTLYSTGDTRLCQLPQSESRNWTSGSKCEPCPWQVFWKCLSVLCKYLTPSTCPWF